MTSSRIVSELVKETYNDDPSNKSGSDGDTQVDLTPVPQDHPTIEVASPVVELAGAPKPVSNLVPDELPVPIVKFDHDFREEQKEMREIMDRKLA